MIKNLEQRFRTVAPKADFVSLRFVSERTESLSVRQDIVQPVQTADDTGVMITVLDGGGIGYGATSDLSETGLRRAADAAREWARRSAGRTVIDFRKVAMPRPQAEHATPVKVSWNSVSLGEKIGLLRTHCGQLKVDPKIVDWASGLMHISTESLYLTADGARAHQRFNYLVPYLSATANEGSETITRSLGGRGYCRQGGMEVIDAVGFRTAAPEIAAEALALLTAPNCPSGAMDLLIAPDQMILQIHESVGHPLELDRILGDERNYAGTSFVTLDMFGKYRYGSDLMNITYDPTRPEQFASFAVDDDGVAAHKEFIIRNGILERPLGSVVSQARAGIAGVANARSQSWNRPPIDRMANLNLEPGTSGLEEMIAAVEHGIYVKTNCSWSIDDSRNKFQFGCEWGRLIENGKLQGLVKKPNYRGISESFWRNLKMVGSPETFELMGTPNCGKGEPNQVVRVGHASPACLFHHVDVFGGE
jgi:predicted Zn-dependent protease